MERKTQSSTPRSTPTPHVGGRRMTRNRALLHGLPTANADAVVGVQSKAAWATAKQFLKRTRPIETFEAEEVASMVAEQFLSKPSFWLATYGTPEKFAFAVTDSRYHDWLGIDRKQRGEGRTLVRDTEGNLHKRRMAVGLEVENADGETVIRPVCSDRDDFVDDVITRVDIGNAATVLPTDQAHAIEDVVIDDRTKVDVAAEIGVAHTTVMHRMNKGLARLRDALGGDYEFAAE